MQALWNAQIEFSVDGQVVVKKQPLRALLGVRQVLVGRPDESGCLFSAHRSKAEGDTWMGYMLPNGSRLQATLDQVPLGGGAVTLHLHAYLGLYTAEGAGKEVTE